MHVCIQTLTDNIYLKQRLNCVLLSAKASKGGGERDLLDLEREKEADEDMWATLDKRYIYIIRIYMCIYVYTYINIRMYIFKYIYLIYISIYVYIYIYKYIAYIFHTYIA